MNQQHPGLPPSPENQPPFGQGYPQNPAGWGPPAGLPPQRPRTGRTLAWLAAGLVLVLVVIGGVALAMSGGDDEESEASGSSTPAAGSGSHVASCQTYLDVVASSEVWAAAGTDPVKMKSMYDQVVADIEDPTVKSLVTAESEAVVAYYEALAEWKTSLEEALSNGDDPDTTMPTEMVALQKKIPAAQGAVLQACADVGSQGGGNDPEEPVPSITAPTLETPAVETPSWMEDQ